MTDLYTRQRERERGHWDALLFECDRVLSIYRREAARLRPRRAWAWLPLGWDVEHTLEALAETEMETEADAATVYAANVAFLARRKATISRSFECWKANAEMVVAGQC